EKDLRALVRVDGLYAPLGSSDELQASTLENLKRHVLLQSPLPSFTTANFQTAVEQARRLIPGLASQMIDCVGNILQLRQQVQQRLGPTASRPGVAESTGTSTRTLHSLQQLGTNPAGKQESPMVAELLALVPPRFLERVSFDRLLQLPRYLKALLTRLERSALNPAKDQERVRQLRP